MCTTYVYIFYCTMTTVNVTVYHNIYYMSYFSRCLLPCVSLTNTAPTLNTNMTLCAYSKGPSSKINDKFETKTSLIEKKRLLVQLQNEI